MSQISLSALSKLSSLLNMFVNMFEDVDLFPLPMRLIITSTEAIGNSLI